MIWPEHTILLAPPREFYFHPRVERGLVGLSQHVCSESMQGWMMDGWRDMRLPADKTTLIRHANRSSRLVSREPKWYAHRDGAVKGCLSRRVGGFMSAAPNAIAINQSLEHHWVCHLTKVIHKKTLNLATLYVELQYSPTNDWSRTEFNDWRNQPSPTAWLGVKKVTDIVVPFTFPEDDLKLLNIAGLGSYDCPVYGLRTEYEAKAVRYEGIIKECASRLEEMTTGKAHRPDMYTKLDHTWSPAKVRKTVKHYRFRLDQIQKRFKEQLEPVAEGQAAVNKFIHERAWKAALLGALQAAELTIKKGDHDQ